MCARTESAGERWLDTTRGVGDRDRGGSLDLVGKTCVMGFQNGKDSLHNIDHLPKKPYPLERMGQRHMLNKYNTMFMEPFEEHLISDLLGKQTCTISHWSAVLQEELGWNS